MTQADTVRTIDAGAPPTRFARGWHCLGLAEDFKDGEPHAINAFGTKLVVFQSGSDGELHVLDGYCRHMGGDLTQGTVKGDEIACPFHDWRWNGSGKCVSIPYAKRVPLRARTRAWRTMEENRQLFVWHDPEGKPPPADITIPRIEGVFNGEWSNWTWESVLIEGANCREIVDNVVDMAHFFYIHFAFPTYFKNVFEGHIASQFLNTKGRPDAGMASNYGGEENLLRSEASYYGPSYMINTLLNTYKGFDVENVLINCHYPVTENSFVLQWGVIVKKLPGVSDEQADRIAGKFAKSIGVGFMQDVEIWKNKTRIDNPLLCEEDGPVYQLRRWYEQFYVDTDEVANDMTRRFEFEVDTSRANEVWSREVAENLRRQRDEAERNEAERNEAQRAEQGSEAGV